MVGSLTRSHTEAREQQSQTNIQPFECSYTGNGFDGSFVFRLIFLSETVNRRNVRVGHVPGSTSHFSLIFGLKPRS